MAYHGALRELHHNIAAVGHSHVDQAERLGYAPIVVVQRQVLVAGLHVLSHLVFDPLKGDTLLVDGLEEDFIRALHLEVELNIVTSNSILQFFLSCLAIGIG